MLLGCFGGAVSGMPDLLLQTHALAYAAYCAVVVSTLVSA